MAEVINLNRVRKARDKQEAVRQAENNRVKFGRTKAEKSKEATLAKQKADLLDGHRLETDKDRQP